MKPARMTFKVFTLALALFTGFACQTLLGETPAAQANVTVFAAASTTNAMTKIGEIYRAQTLGNVTLSFASSSTLAKQIGNGAPADVYLSANIKWMDYLQEKNMLATTTRFDLLRNRIVLIAPMASALAQIEIKPGFSPAEALGKNGRLAMGDPSHVPAGIYGKKALTNLNSWEGIKAHLAPMKDVRAALVLVERGESPLGLVYATDAAISKKVRVVGTFPENCHPPIVYPVAAIKGNHTDEAQRFLNFLNTPTAQAVFEKYGFGIK